MKKSINGYHDNKNRKTTAFFVDSDGEIKRQELKSDRRYFGMELELELDRNVSLSSDSDQCPHCSGNRRIPCPTCNGEPHECDQCHGFGFTGDGVPCEHCQRTGVVLCPTCQGLGNIECPSCHGTGRLADETASVLDVPEPWDRAVVYERDGSLNHGFEVINEPMTYNAMMKYLSSDYMAKLMSYNQIRDSNGVHVHVSKVSSEHTKRVQMMMARLSKKLADLTRSSSYARWYHAQVSLSDTDLKKTIETADPSVFGGNHAFLFYRYLSGDQNAPLSSRIDDVLRDRYSCLNIGNSATLEFRFFNTTKDQNRLMKYINLVNSIMALADEGKPLSWYACAQYSMNDDWVVDANPTTYTFDIIKRVPPTITPTYNLNGRSLRTLLNTMATRSQILGSYTAGDTVGFDTSLCVREYNLGDVSDDVLSELRGAKYGIVKRLHRYGSAGATNTSFNPTPDMFVVDLLNANGELIVTRAIPSYLIAGRVNVVQQTTNRRTVSC